MSYLGVGPDQDIVVNTHEYVATAGQTTFNAVYDDYVKVYLNGTLLADSDYVATDGVTVVLNVGAAAGDIVAVDGYESFKYNNSVMTNTDQTISGKKTFTKGVVVADAVNDNEAVSLQQLSDSVAMGAILTTTGAM